MAQQEQPESQAIKPDEAGRGKRLVVGAGIGAVGLAAIAAIPTSDLLFPNKVSQLTEVKSSDTQAGPIALPTAISLSPDRDGSEPAAIPTPTPTPDRPLEPEPSPTASPLPQPTEATPTSAPPLEREPTPTASPSPTSAAPVASTPTPEALDQTGTSPTVEPTADPTPARVWIPSVRSTSTPVPEPTATATPGVDPTATLVWVTPTIESIVAPTAYAGLTGPDAAV